jgi:hypothetical protein
MITLTLQDLQVKTVEQLREIVSKLVNEQVTDELLIWGNCCFNASMVLDSYDTKDIAHMFLGGVTSYNNIECVQSTIDTFYEDPGENDSALHLIQYYVEQQFGVDVYEDQFQAFIYQLEGDEDYDDSDDE